MGTDAKHLDPRVNDIPAFSPPPFCSHRLIRGGHLQTIVSLRAPKITFVYTRTEIVPVDDGDAIALHWDGPSEEHLVSDPPVILLVHGLSGCHGSPYMIRLAHRFTQAGFVVVRMDMRGCGAASELATQVTHAGRSDDIHAALDSVHRQMPRSPLHAIGVSLGGNQLLRLVCRIGAAEQPRPAWFNSLHRIAVVAPPIDLMRCSENMQRISRRPYNWYFIRQLFRRLPRRVCEREDFQKVIAGPRPKTLWELDDRMTAPMSGFSGAAEYYRECGTSTLVAENPIATLVLAAEDDPIVPVACFREPKSEWPKSSTVVISPSGGHAGFVGRRGEFWMDTVLAHWFGSESEVEKTTFA